MRAVFATQQRCNHTNVNVLDGNIKGRCFLSCDCATKGVQVDDHLRSTATAWNCPNRLNETSIIELIFLHAALLHALQKTSLMPR